MAWKDFQWADVMTQGFHLTGSGRQESVDHLIGLLAANLTVILMVATNLTLFNQAANPTESLRKEQVRVPFTMIWVCSLMESTIVRINLSKRIVVR